MVSLIQHFEADFLWKVSIKILNSGIILKTSTQRVYTVSLPEDQSCCYDFLSMKQFNFCSSFSMKTIVTVQSLYSSSSYYMDLDITQVCCGSQQRGTCICAHAWIFFKLCTKMTHYILTMKMYLLN